MASYDAEIRISTRIDNKNFDAGAKDIQHSLDDIEKGIDTAKAKLKDLESLGLPKGSQVYRDAAKDLEKWTAELDKVKGKQQETTADFGEHINLMRVDVEEYANTLKELEQQGKYFGDADYDEVYKAWRQATEEVRKYQSELNKQTEQGKAAEAAKAAREAEKQAKVQAQTAEEQRLAQIKAQATVSDQRIVELLERKKQLTAQIAELEKAGVGRGYQEYDSRQAELKGINTQLGEGSDLGATAAQFGAIAGKVSKIVAIVGTAVVAIKKVTSAAKSLAAKVYSIVSGIVKKVGGAVKAIATQAGKLFSKLTSGFKSSGQASGSFQKRLLGLVKSVFVFNIISKAFQSMVTGVQDSIKKFTQYSGSFNGDVSSLVNALSTLKNAIAGAFAPILSVAIPYLVQLINYVTMAVNAVAQLIAALTGASTWNKAIQQNEDYAASLGGVAGSAKKAAGALAKFDDLDVLQKQDDSSGGGSGAGANNLWEEVPISNSIKDFAKKLKDIFASEDWSDLGDMIAQKIIDFLFNIPWDEIQSAAERLGKQFGSLLNAVLTNYRLWEELGIALAQGLNTALIFLYYFLNEFDFETIGRNIGDGINAAVADFNWELLAQTIILGINGAVALAYGFISTIDLAGLGQKLGETLFTVLNNLPYEMTAETVVRGIGKISDAIINFVSSIDFGTLAEHMVNMVNRIIRGMEFDSSGNELGNVWEKNGKAVGMAIQGLVEYAYTFLSNLDYSTLAKNIAAWFNNAISEIDGEMVGDTIESVINGLLDFVLAFLEEIDWDQLGNKIADMLRAIDWDVVKEKAKDICKELLGAIEELLGEDVFKIIGLNIINGLLAGLQSAMQGNTLLTAMIEILQLFVEGVKAFLGIHSPSTVFQEIGTFLIEGLLLGIQETWTRLTEWFTTTFEELTLFFEEKWTAIKEKALEIWNLIKDSILETWENLKTSASEKFEDMKLKIEEVWTSIKNHIDLKVKGIKEKIEELLLKITGFKESATNAFDNVKESIVNALQNVIDKLKEFIQWVKDAIQAVQDFFSSDYDKVGTTAGKTSKSVSTRSVMSASPVSVSTDIPHLASGGVIRGGNPFLAVLGDQRSGQTNVEAPLSTIRQALREELGGVFGGSSGVKVVLQVNGVDLAQATLQDFLSEMSRQGLDVDVLGVT